MSDNPYQAPTAVVADPAPTAGEPASRLVRLGAHVVDSLLIALPWLVAAVAIPFAVEYGVTPEDSHALWVAVPVGATWLALLATNALLIHRHGQTVAKRWFGIRIRRADGRPVTLARVFLLRFLVIALLGAIPLLGVVVTLVDALLIFRADRRCLHDLIADTVVVRA